MVAGRRWGTGRLFILELDHIHFTTVDEVLEHHGEQQG